MSISFNSFSTSLPSPHQEIKFEVVIDEMRTRGDVTKKKCFNVLKSLHPDDPFLSAFEKAVQGDSEIDYTTEDRIFSPNTRLLCKPKLITTRINMESLFIS